MQALQWQVKQRTQESKDAQSQLKMCEQRMQIETESIRTALAVSYFVGVFKYFRTYMYVFAKLGISFNESCILLNG